ncbi:asparagine synthase B [Thiospirochaeta perfilievii]|uniref:asparagine synthase (glutamine-hydrolyzing) n=1 Tax=Thiospirochaeta perfilievii TaxID=252967 RepID=A0A5C1Q9X4_9SPIO|nr:asparagine synthase B [Thiospirochaeta perfilievii]QEN03709.1 asparagine synthase B [Thiospirochaeta perfilievii]
MCSIVGVFNTREDASLLRAQALEMSRKLRHRGPDWSGIFSNEKAILVHERLSIVGVENGAQPLYSSDNNQVLAVNGEIYNHREIKNSLNYNFATNSDCEVILPLYREKGVNFLNDLNGIFAFALYDQTDDSYLIARDPIGVIPLYYGRDEDGILFVASEMKALTGYCKQINDFPPGHYYSSKDGEFVKYYNKDWFDYENVKDNLTSVPDIKSALEAAVHRQLMCDVPYGVLLSGGLDSSITSAIAKRFAAKRIESDDKSDAWWPQLHSFAVGLHDSPDLVAAKKVAEQIGTIHHEINFTVQEGFDALRDVIYHLETFDVTTIRSSTPMFLMARVIKSMGIKMVISGEGADEIFGGYLYFHKAPNPEELHKETVRKLEKLYKYDCLRSNKSMASWGIESRVPFLDLEFLDVAMRQNPKDKMPSKERMEKYILREAFEDYLPNEVAWRQKEQFSDGVGYSWIDGLKDKAESEITDEQFASAKYKFPINTPRTKEEYMYRSIFAELFPEDDAVNCVPFEESIACSTAIVFEWDQTLKEMADPSGRSVKTVHDKSY